ncbi:MAG TPA: WD40 repeat domain-containing protein [Nevskiaceae bacterium]|nr:WD40 repeat domain-containing protein [Nevskiaceae bacterium]
MNPLRLCNPGLLGPILLALSACSGGNDLPPGGEADPPPEGKRDVLVVSNNWSGTADFVDVHTFERLMRLDIVPDKDERVAEITSNPAKLAYFLLIRQQIGEGHDQYVDDSFLSKDGRFLYVSRPSFCDVVAFDLTTRTIAWRTSLEGYRADHMAISPDGTRLAVSASTANIVEILDTRTGAVVGQFESGDSPHENNYSADGSKIFHASIGLVYTPTEGVFGPGGSLKGERYFQVVDTSDNAVLKRVDMGQKLEEAGYPGMSAAVRPMAIAPDENTFFFQVSFFHGFVQYDLAQDKVVRVVDLPKRTTEPLVNYQLDSAHHGLAIRQDGSKLCAAGTMDGYAAMVSTSTFDYTLVDVGPKPYWTTPSDDGRYCFVSVSEDDAVAVIDFDTNEMVEKFAVGDHPQRMRTGQILNAVLSQP